MRWKNSLKAQGEGKTSIEPRVHIHPNPEYHGHFNVLRGYIEPKHAVGVKIVGDYVFNYEKNLPSEMSLLNLFRPGNGSALCRNRRNCDYHHEDRGNNRGWG